MKGWLIRRSLIAALVFAGGTVALAQVPISPLPANQPVAPRLSGFSVVMVEGTLNPAGPGPSIPSEAIPQAAARALEDLKDLLAYKSFRLLDTQWIRGSGKLAGRLRGPNGAVYDLLLIGFQSGGTRAPGEVHLQQFQLSSRDGRPVIHTSFRMELGETLVVGTSHLQGDKALIVLLTAVSQ